jgi:hypothetical protein
MMEEIEVISDRMRDNLHAKMISHDLTMDEEKGMK